MAKEVTVDLDEARGLMYERIFEDDRLPDEFLETKLREAYVQTLEEMYDNADELAQQIAKLQAQQQAVEE